MPASASRTLLRTCVALSVALPLACGRGPAEPASAPPGEATAPPASPTAGASSPAGDDACRSWADLDLQGLPPLPQTEYTATFETVWRTVLEKHYDPTLNCQDWPATRLEYGERLAELEDEAAAFALIAQMLSSLGQSHLAVMPPRREAAGEPRAATRTGDARLPLKARMVGGQVIVVDPVRDGAKSGLPRGAQVLAIDQDEVAPMITRMFEHVPREIEARFAVRRVVNNWMVCPSGESRKVRYQALGAAKPRSKTVKCHPYQVERVTLGNLKNVPVTVEHRMLPKSTIGYLHFNIWMVPLMTKIEAAIAQMREQGMTGLVLDLRGNPGGVGPMVVPLGRLLLSEAADLGTMHMRQGTQTFNVAAGDDPFTGPVAVLIDDGTASTSEIFAQAMQDLGRVQVFGASPSQGAALPSVIETLPGGGMLQYVVADYQSPKGTVVEGKGVIPDTVVAETREDFARGRDPVLEPAVAAIGG